MDLKERLISCKKCEHRTFDSAVGLVCSLTSNKPNFEVNCSDFVLDAKEAQKIKNTAYTHSHKQNDTSGTNIWGYVITTLIILKILYRFLRD